MIGVAIMMNGGPGLVWGPRALAAFHEFADDAEADAGTESAGASSAALSRRVQRAGATGVNVQSSA